nr:PREDICTED: dnaJ homolog subfamily C member 3 [Apteryx mantelli mantelli]
MYLCELRRRWQAAGREQRQEDRDSPQTLPFLCAVELAWEPLGMHQVHQAQLQPGSLPPIANESAYSRALPLILGHNSEARTIFGPLSGCLHLKTGRRKASGQPVQGVRKENSFGRSRRKKAIPNCHLIGVNAKGAECGINAEVEKQLEMGKKLLAAGQLADALSHFHAAIEGDSDNYIAYYRRATVYLAMGKSKAAIRDLSKVVELKQDFTSARLQRGHLLLKQGKFDEAEDDFKNVLKSNPSNNEEKEAQSQLTKSDELQRLHSQALSAYQQEDYEGAISLLDEILAVCVWDAELRELRAECYIKEGEPSKAISDLKAAAKLKNDNTEAFYKISRIYYQLGDHELSLSEVRECLKLDQDHKQCFSLYKQVKKLNKQIESAEEFIREGRYEDAISKYDSVMKTEPEVPIYATRAKERICHCLSKNQQATEAIKVCTEVLQLEPTNVNALKDRAEAYLLEDLYEEAIKDYETAQANSENDQQIREGLERAQRMLKQSQKRDYYKILGVKRNARKQEIIKAYRKLASQWHPDNFQSEEEKKKAEKKFIDIAAAKEVLTDPEMRRKFDAGEDPLDAESQQGGGNPFHRNWNTWQGFNPFGSGGGPFTFKFHFS